MTWKIEYFEQGDTTQPAEVFEDALDRTHPKLSGKLLRIAPELQLHGYSLGGGYIENVMNTRGCGRFELSKAECLRVSFLALMESTLCCCTVISNEQVNLHQLLT